jgi:hypothetical protein
MVVGAGRRQSRGLVEDGAMLLNKDVHEGLLGSVDDFHSQLLQDRLLRGPHTLLVDASALALERQGQCSEVPLNGTQCLQEVHVEDEVEAA